jgi:hypothetical protein
MGLKELVKQFIGDTQILEAHPFNPKESLEKGLSKAKSIFENAKSHKVKLEIYGSFSASIEKIQKIAEKALKEKVVLSQNKINLNLIREITFSILLEIASFEEGKLDEETARGYMEKNLKSIQARIEELS